MPQLDTPIPEHKQRALCPCGSQISLSNCCLPLLSGQTHAKTAEQLMRSRYSAHVLLQIEYLWQTWMPEVRQRSSRE